MNIESFFQTSSIAIAFFSVAIYAVVAHRLPKTPWSIKFFGAGFTLNAIQKLTLKLSESELWNRVVLMDHTFLPWMEACCYAAGAVLFLSHMERAEKTFKSRVQDFLKE